MSSHWSCPCLALLLLNGCATLFTGTSDTLTFNANVPGVRLSIDGRNVGELPLKLEQSRNFVGGKLFTARFEKAGFATQEFQLSREFNPVAILDIGSTVTSGGIDLLTGALMRFSPRDYQVQMLAADAAPPVRAAFQRGLELRRFAVINQRRLQTDLARGGGEHLSALAWMVGNGDPAAAHLVVRQAVAAAPALVAASEARAFVDALGRVLAEPALRAARFE